MGNFMTESTISNHGGVRCRKDIFTNHQSVSHLISAEDVCRTALATPGLLIMVGVFALKSIIFNANKI